MSPALKKFLIIVAIGTILGAAYSVRAHKEPLSSETLHAIASADAGIFEQRSKVADCIRDGAYPDPACTPGAIFENVTTEDICRPGYSRSARNVSLATKNSVYAAYGIATHATGEYEVDHFVSLELGGSNDVANLFPEPAEPKPGFHEKDEVENYLHAQMCEGNITMHDAQVLVSHHWLEVYDLLH